MKPRVFVSSTYYDLKYLREDLSNFIEGFSLEPILFEDGNIGLTPHQQLDESCYLSAQEADMFILIVGGRYGSEATKQTVEEKISITRREFRAAVGKGIPVFVFIDRDVYAEFELYSINEKVGTVVNDITFRCVDDINVFKFIKEIKKIDPKLSIKSFEKTDEIKAFLGGQLADMLRNFLKISRGDAEQNKLESGISEVKALIEKVERMVNAIGKKTIEEDEYAAVVEQQKLIGDLNGPVLSARAYTDTLISRLESKKSESKKSESKKSESEKSESKKYEKVKISAVTAYNLLKKDENGCIYLEKHLDENIQLDILLASPGSQIAKDFVENKVNWGVANNKKEELLAKTVDNLWELTKKNSNVRGKLTSKGLYYAVNILYINKNGIKDPEDYIKIDLYSNNVKDDDRRVISFTRGDSMENFDFFEKDFDDSFREASDITTNWQPNI